MICFFFFRVLIVDFDIHHGNGTQDLFYNDKNVLYISIHKFDNGNFYPYKPSAGARFVGHGPGEGYNVNIPFNNVSFNLFLLNFVFNNIFLGTDG